jgi:hypothetical protein
LHNLKYLLKTFERKALGQLERGVNYIKTNFEDFRALTAPAGLLPEGIELAQIQIKPLILSTIFDGDSLSFKTSSGFSASKASIFELRMILSNKLYDIMRIKFGDEGKSLEIDPHTVMQLSNMPQPQKEWTREDLNLWSGQSCGAQDLLEAIHEDKVWKHLDATYQFPAGEVSISPFSKEKRILS